MLFTNLYLLLFCLKCFVLLSTQFLRSAESSHGTFEFRLSLFCLTDGNRQTQVVANNKP